MCMCGFRHRYIHQLSSPVPTTDGGALATQRGTSHTQPGAARRRPARRHVCRRRPAPHNAKPIGGRSCLPASLDAVAVALHLVETARVVGVEEVIVVVLVRLPLGKQTEDGDRHDEQHAKKGVLADAQRLSGALTTRLIARERAKIQRASGARPRLGRDHLGVGSDGCGDGGGGELAECVIHARHLRQLERRGGANEAGEEQLLHGGRADLVAIT
mmetsp:Transcript_25882/g.83606  ORF Transcript_25882/g.83606 Transcript_25882/m.83606 type:complete len:215 (+) Transcript_25882:211-855(+)